MSVEEILQLFNWLVDEPIWAMLLGACLGLFAIALFAKLHRSGG